MVSDCVRFAASDTVKLVSDRPETLVRCHLHIPTRYMHYGHHDCSCGFHLVYYQHLYEFYESIIEHVAAKQKVLPFGIAIDWPSVRLAEIAREVSAEPSSTNPTLTSPGHHLSVRMA